MELRKLRVFVEVVRQGGFSAAAETLFATQSTVSKSVRQLEDEIGMPLLNRIGHRITMTEAGEVVFRRAQQLLADREDLIAELDDIRGLRRGTLRLGLPPIGSSVLFAPVFTLYRKRYPGIDVSLVEHGGDRLDELLQAGEIDLAGSLLPIPEQEYDWQTVRCEPLVALLARGHPLKDAGPVTLKDLKDVPFILFESGFALNRIIIEACRAQGFEPQIVARSSQLDFVVELAAAGLGVAFLPRMIADERRRAAVDYVPLKGHETDWNLAVTWRRNGYLSKSAQAWLACLREIHQDV
ncbi:LysR family transcriptional regulator [Methyloligella solikamskensis]|uniref:LysR family transcriptional regulator n=1 Tax=Methyloligella solikamskensis TaxID=1177756 RepID=A0ABW3J8T0_9HYPH